MTLTANSSGVIRGKFTIPANVTSGAKEVIATGAGGAIGKSVFTGQGTLQRQLYQQQTTILDTRWQSPPPVFFPVLDTGSDPLAETFTLPTTRQVSGVDLWFVGKPTTNTRVQIRSTLAGVPSQNVITEAVLTPIQIVGNSSATTPPPVGGIEHKVFAVNGSGTIAVPQGVTTITLVGNGTAGVVGVTAVAPTYANWIFGSATVAGTSSDGAGYLNTGEIPTNTATINSSFVVHGVANWSLGITSGESITFAPDPYVVQTDVSKVYRGVAASGTIIQLTYSRQNLTTGVTGVAAAAGSDTTAVINGVTTTFAGASTGVGTTPAATTQNVTVSGATATAVSYNVPTGGSLQVKYDVIYTGDTSGGNPPGDLSATRVTFPWPVTLLANVEYAIVILCNDAVGSLAVAEIGKFDVNAQKWITSQPYTIGTLLSSSNTSTWTAHQDRDLTFALLTPGYSETTHTYALGSISVSAATDLIVMSFAEMPASDAIVQYRLTLPDTSTILVTDGQPVQLAAPITGSVGVEAILSGSDMAPILHRGTQIAVGKIATSATYVTRAIPAGSSVRVKVIFEALVPSGANLTVQYRGIDSGDTWASVPALSNTPADDGFTEFTYQVTGVTETAVQIKLTLSGNTAARPRVRDLRVMVL